MTDPAHAPRCSGFEYVLIPANDGELPSVRKFSGSTDDEFRSEITAHFRQTLLNPEQQTQFANTLIAKAAAQRDKAAQKPPEDATTSGPVGQAGASEAKTEGVDVNEMVSQVTSETNFEIVPVTLPCRANRFTATSLYIDDAGRFKELPLNSRASRIAQRDVRGDAFLCSNHDDPALESWERVDCTMEVYKEMHSHPPTNQLDTNNNAAMMSAGMARESDTKVITADDVAEASKLRAAANAAFTAGNIQEALEKYDHALERLQGRTDLLPNEQEAVTIRLAVTLNRSLCHLKLQKYFEAEKDARAVISHDSKNAKAWFRLATAQVRQRDYDAARVSLVECSQHGGPSNEVQLLSAELEAGARSLRDEAKKQYGKMFR